MKVMLQQAAQHEDTTLIPQDKDFQQWANAVEIALQPAFESEVCVRIVNADESHHLNQRYRQQDQATNVLAFPCTDQAPDEMHYLGDIVLSLETMLHEAAEQHKPVLNHWAHLFIHGLLHLYDYRHDEPVAAKRMRKQEISILHRLGFANPYT